MPGGAAGMKKEILFDGVPHPVAFTGCGNLMPLLERFFPGWSRREVPPGTAGEAIIDMARTRTGTYRIDAPWLERPLYSSSTTGAMCNLSVDLVNAYFRFNPEVRCIHAAGAEFSGRLVLFPNTNKAGKSLLAVGLMRAGVSTFGDDMLALSADGRAMSFGIPPRLRKPLPDTEPEIRAYSEERILVEDAWYRYLDASEPGLAAFGRRMPVGAVVVLDRRDGGGAALSRIDSVSAAQALAGQQFMREGEALDLLSYSRVLAANTACWLLTYSGVEEAVAVLSGAFAAKGEGFVRLSVPEPAAAARVAASNGRERRGRLARPSSHPYVRHPGATAVDHGEGAFLVGHDRDSIFRINRVGLLVWQMLETPCSEREIADALADAFPDEPKRAIEADIVGLFADLQANGLIWRDHPAD